GDKAEDVSNQNVPGDYLVTLDPDTIPGHVVRVAIDAKDKVMGLKACEDTLRESKGRWSTHGALLVFAREEQTAFSPPGGLRRLVDVLHRECREKLEEAWQALGVTAVLPSAVEEQ